LSTIDEEFKKELSRVQNFCRKGTFVKEITPEISAAE